MTSWNPEQYNRFKNERSQPFLDLMKLIQARKQSRAIDLGCGTGELTNLLFEDFQIKDLVGMDSSEAMLEKSKAYVKKGLSFEKGDIETYRPEAPFDLIISNAALQWTADHERLLPKILSWVTPGGEIAIQMPCNTDHPSHRIAAEVALELFPEKFPLNSYSRSVLSLERYAEILYSQGFHRQNCRIQIYGHSMASGRDVIEWTKGTLLTRYQSELSASEFQLFLSRYEKALIATIGEGAYYYAFKRMLLWGVKG